MAGEINPITPPQPSGIFRGTGSQNVSVSGVGDLVSLWIRRHSDSNTLRNLHEPWWSKYWSWYRAKLNELGDPADWWRSNEVIPEMFKVIETILPRHIIGMFNGPEWFNVRSRKGLGQAWERRVQSLLFYSVERMKLFPKLYECLKYASIMGHVWGKIVWRREFADRIQDITVRLTDEGGRPSLDDQGRERITSELRNIPELIYDDVDFEWVDNYHLWPDPTGKGRWYIEEAEVLLDDLIEKNEETSASPIYKNLDKLRQTGETSISASESDENEQTRIEGISQDTTSIARDGQSVKIWQCWGWVPKRFRLDDGFAWRLQTIANERVVIRDKPMPTPDLRPPFFPIKSIPIPNRLYGESILHYVGPLSDQKNRIENWRMDEVLQNIWGQYVINRNAGVTDNKLFLQPGGALFVDGNPKDVFALVPRKPVLPEAYTESANKSAQIESTSAATPLAQGVSEGGRQTAREVGQRAIQGNARFELNTMWYDYTVKKELLERTYKLYQRHLSPGRFVRMVGQPDQATDLRLEDIQTPIDITIDSGIFAFNRLDDLQSLSQILDLAFRDPEVRKHIKIREIVSETVNRLGWPDVQRFLKSEDQVKQEDQQNFQRQMQLAMAQLKAEIEKEQQIDTTKAEAEGSQRIAQTAVKGQFDLAKERIRQSTHLSRQPQGPSRPSPKR